jgi:hypothetical protein
MMKRSLFLLLVLSTASCRELSDDDHNPTPPASELEVDFHVGIMNGTARAAAKLHSTKLGYNIYPGGLDPLFCQGVRLFGSNAAIDFDNAVGNEVPLTQDGLYRFEIVRHTGTRDGAAIAAIDAAITSPSSGATMHAGAPLRVEWSRTKDHRVGIYVKVLDGCSFDDGTTEWGASDGSGAGTIETPIVRASGRCTAGISVSTEDSLPVGSPFAGGTISISSLSYVEVVLEP